MSEFRGGEQKPKFVINRFQGAVVLMMNLAMADELAYTLDDFETLQPHLFTLRRKLHSAVGPQGPQEVSDEDGDEEDVKAA